jgi:predicted RNase H-like HicB family nuclease
MKQLTLDIIYTTDKQGGGYSGYIAQFPSLIAQGTTKKEIEEKLYESLVDILEYYKEQELFINPIGEKEVHSIRLEPVN